MGYRFVHTPNEEDWFEFQKFAMEKTPAGKKLRFFSRVLVPLIIGVMFLASNIGTWKSPMDAFIAFIAAGLALLTCFILYQPVHKLSTKLMTAMYKKSGKLSPKGENITAFGDEYFIDEFPEEKTKVNYTAIERVEKGDAAIYIFTTAVKACILPNRVFRDEREREEFFAFIRSKISK